MPLNAKRKKNNVIRTKEKAEIISQSCGVWKKHIKKTWIFLQALKQNNAGVLEMWSSCSKA